MTLQSTTTKQRFATVTERGFALALNWGSRTINIDGSSEQSPEESCVRVLLFSLLILYLIFICKINCRYNRRIEQRQQRSEQQAADGGEWKQICGRSFEPNNGRSLHRDPKESLERETVGKNSRSNFDPVKLQKKERPVSFDLANILATVTSSPFRREGYRSQNIGEVGGNWRRIFPSGKPAIVGILKTPSSGSPNYARAA